MTMTSVCGRCGAVYWTASGHACGTWAKCPPYRLLIGKHGADRRFPELSRMLGDNSGGAR